MNREEDVVPKSQLSEDLELRHLATIMEASDDAIVSIDLTGTVTSWNRAAERLFGWLAAEATGRPLEEIVPNDRLEEARRLMTQLRSGQGVRHLQTIRRRRDGTRVPVSITVAPIRDDQGDVIGASLITRDISARLDADLVARRLAAIVDSSDDAIVAKNLDSTITAWNRGAERLFGYTAAEAIGQSVRMIIPPELHDEEDQVLARIRAGQAVDHFETRRRRKDGTELQISLSVSPIRDDNGAVIGASKIARDITERARLSALAQEQALVSARLAEVGAAVISSLDQATVVQRVTDVARALTGAEFGAFFYNAIDQPSGKAYTLHTLSGAPKEAFANFPQPRATALFAPTFNGQGVVRLDDVTRDPRYGKNLPYHGMPDGHLPVRGYLAVPVKAASGEVLGGLFFGHSQAGVFTETHERLVTGIAAWAALALENSRLYAVAREADRIKDEFLAVLSHELRTPLSAIVGYARLFRERLLTDEEYWRGLEVLDRNANALTQIVDDVLDVSRIVSGKLRLDVQPVELSLVVDNAVATLRPAADAKGVRLQTIVDPRIGPVSGDADRLQQVVWNLLSNAVKFTPKQGRVQVRIERVNSHIEIAVSDTGIGIPNEVLPHVFERFWQGEGETTARSTRGLGLGLSIVRHIVELHGGSVEAASDGADRGSTFRVRLPLMIVHPAPLDEIRAHPLTPRMARLGELGSLTGTHVLIIDDDSDALTLLGLVLETAGATVSSFSSAIDAFERLGEIEPQVMIVDLGMPQMDGFEFIASVRNSPEAKIREIPAAALTALARSEDRTKALRSGFEMHLAKPVDPGELIASIDTLVRRGRRDRTE